LYTPYDANKSASSDEISSEETKSNDSSEDLVPSTPSDEVTSSEKGKPIKKKQITSYYDAQTSIDISKQFDDSSAVKLDLVVLIDDNSTKSEELKAERIRLNFRDYFHYAISSKN
jgi:hypothetical protein